MALGQRELILEVEQVLMGELERAQQLLATSAFAEQFDVAPREPEGEDGSDEGSDDARREHLPVVRQRCDDGRNVGQRGEDDSDAQGEQVAGQQPEDRKSTRLNSSHVANSYAVFCLKKKTS